ncbi:hypothetical protein RJ640_006460 [Escallonia rubra]|uniref:Wall-associated receptor kinase galacturonan-binding domain-containing protein n=1 Tax=Escallonia rubra TaxID=112253 RepID=A0AA88R620_9ASTE|nr:hypothetical protein RJ640_006460 [Escallonia rubra]
MLILALWCIQTKPSDRPSTSKLVEMLERGGEFLQMPPKPFLYLHEMPARDHGMAIINPSEISLPFEDLIFEGSCKPSSCGSIQNITCPFQLKGQNPPSQRCYNTYYSTDRRSFQVTCQNNVTILALAPSRNYHVQSINYNNNSIRLVDSGLRKADCSTTPVHSLSVGDVPPDFYLYASWNKPVVFLECKNRPVSTRYVVAGGGGTCGNASGTYVVLGDMVVSEVEGSCSVSKVAWVSSHYGRLIENSSYLDIHGGMAYGFELSFEYYTYCFNPSSFRPTSRCKYKFSFLPSISSN